MWLLHAVMFWACMWCGLAENRLYPCCHDAQTVGPNDPEQVHLALGAAGEMYVSWVTGDYVQSATAPVIPTTNLKTQVGAWEAWSVCCCPCHEEPLTRKPLHAIAGQVRAAATEAGPACIGRARLLCHEQHRQAPRCC